MLLRARFASFFFFNDTATTEIYTLSLHDALPISVEVANPFGRVTSNPATLTVLNDPAPEDRKSTRLNSSHGYISYAVFCLKKKKKGLDIVCCVTTSWCSTGPPAHSSGDLCVRVQH